MTRINPELKKLVDETFFSNRDMTYDEHEKFLIYLAANFGWQHATYRAKFMLHDINTLLSQMAEEQEYPESTDKEGGEHHDP